jgi:hypothetical protein
MPQPRSFENASRMAIEFATLALSLGLLAGCATSPSARASDRAQGDSGCVAAALGFNSSGNTQLPFAIDRDAFQRCEEAGGGRYHLPPPEMQAP